MLVEIARTHEHLYSPYLDSPAASPQAIDVLMAGYGIFASGPQVVLNEYINILSAHGVACHLTSTPKQTKPRATALLMDRGFIVSEYMWAEQIL